MRRAAIGVWVMVTMLGAAGAPVAGAPRGLAGSARFAAEALGAPGLPSRSAVGPYLDGALPSTIAGALPALLSETGVFSNLATLTPHAGLVPYTVAAPLWTDGALKFRWIAIPNDGPPYGPNERATFAQDGAWAFPAGTVLVKHFELIVNQITQQRRRLETRLVVRNASGGIYAITYKWRADQTEADLIDAGFDEVYSIVTPTGTVSQIYTYPGRAECLRCHNVAAGQVLGPKTAQLNSDLLYPTGITDNQLNTWNHLQMIQPALDPGAIPALPRMRPLDDSGARLALRVRSYIDSNCAHCHRPGGEGPVFDGRFEVPLAQSFLIGAAAIVPGNVAGSRVHQRMSLTSGAGGMPPLAKNVLDQQSLNVLADWIVRLCEQPPVFEGAGYALPGTCRISLGWNAAETPWCGAPVVYSIYRSTNPTFLPGPATLLASGVGALSYDDTLGLTNGTTYHYVVRAVNANTGRDDGNLFRKSATASGCPTPGVEDKPSRGWR